MYVLVLEGAAFTSQLDFHKLLKAKKTLCHHQIQQIFSQDEVYFRLLIFIYSTVPTLMKLSEGFKLSVNMNLAPTLC